MICIIIPVKKLEYTKSRLSSILNKDQRIRLSLYMLEDLLNVIDIANRNIFKPIVIGSDQAVKEIADRFDAYFIEDANEGVNEAVRLADDVAKDYDASLVIPIDLILLEPIDLIMLYDIAEDIDKGVIITPSARLDGTNILLRKPSSIIDTYYDMDSYLLHMNKALEDGLDVRILLNTRITYDLDSIRDLKYAINTNINKKSILYLNMLKRYVSKS
ncbi:MAG: hypothetical protein KatS3mg003_1259 [Candidatus Nitrosocaldaceae archaeon]|nr:MAG: hypothetical protein KatS3mg003_0748 [Candidatus Nitrosocaldaceae archaeon]GIU71780.1 MAG: hypothetical protein KatS3mg003_1259 [Candidatus Nitrosocaldaceae archaeon]